MNELQHQFNLQVQVVNATIKRNSRTFNQNIFDGSQCNAALSNPFMATQTTKQTVNKLIFLQDVDVVFADEADFYY